MFKLYKFHQYACQNLFLFFCILYRKCMIISALYIVFCSFNSGIEFFSIVTYSPLKIRGCRLINQNITNKCEKVWVKMK